jgi:hypothetical protein
VLPLLTDGLGCEEQKKKERKKDRKKNERHQHKNNKENQKQHVKKMSNREQATTLTLIST